MTRMSRRVVAYCRCLKGNIVWSLNLNLITSLTTGAESYISSCVRRFGRWQGAQHLSEVVLDLYDASLRESTRKTYKTGQRAYDRFLATLNHGVRFPFLQTVITETELDLAFYLA